MVTCHVIGARNVRRKLVRRIVMINALLVEGQEEPLLLNNTTKDFRQFESKIINLKLQTAYHKIL